MMKTCRKKAGFFTASACAGALLMCGMPLNVSADGSVEDVYAAMRDIGMSEAMVQQARNQYQTTPHDDEGMEINGHYATYTVWAEYVYIYEDQIWEVIDEQFLGGSDGDDPASNPTTTAPADGGAAVTTTTTRTAEERKEFINMTLEEKKAYVNSLPKDERIKFLRSLSTAERNSIIKQLDPDSQAEIAEGFVDLSKQLGMNVTVDSIGSGGIDYTVRDGDGNVIDKSAVGTQIEDTGWNTTLPVLGACAAILAALGGLLLNALRTKKREEAAADV